MFKKYLNPINFIKKFLILISRVIYKITPDEFPLKKKELEFLKTRSPITRYLAEYKVNSTFSHFKDIFKQSVLFNSRHEIREYAIKESCSIDKNREFFYLEFGVFQGTSANFF